MTPRERFLSVFHYQDVDRVPDCEFGYWGETLARWRNEGLPLWVTDDHKADMFFGFEERDIVPVHMPFRPFKHEVLGEDDRTETIRDSGGVVMRRWKSGVSNSIPHYIEFPVKDRDTWEDFRERFDLENISHPHNWDELKEKWRESTRPVGVNGGGFFGWVRGMMGVKATVTTFYSDPDLIREMMDFRAEMTLRGLERPLKEVKLDFSSWWEDMCYNTGPLISPKLFEEFMVPQYKKITGPLAEKGVDINILDCDGNITKLVPLWLDAGINCMFPLEIRGGTDPYQLRKEHGRRVILLGGVDKIALVKGPEAIDRELERVGSLMVDGGFVPHVDHRVPADVSYDNYLYYLDRKRRMIRKS